MFCLRLFITHTKNVVENSLFKHFLLSYRISLYNLSLNKLSLLMRFYYSLINAFSFSMSTFHTSHNDYGGHQVVLSYICCIKKLHRLSFGDTYIILKDILNLRKDSFEIVCPLCSVINKQTTFQFMSSPLDRSNPFNELDPIQSLILKKKTKRTELFQRWNSTEVLIVCW